MPLTIQIKLERLIFLVEAKKTICPNTNKIAFDDNEHAIIFKLLKGETKNIYIQGKGHITHVQMSKM